MSPFATDYDINVIEKIFELERFYNFLITKFRECISKKEQLTYGYEAEIIGSEAFVDVGENKNKNAIPKAETKKWLKQLRAEAPITYNQARSLLIMLEPKVQKYVKAIKLDLEKFPTLDILG
ncbi:MAG: hypothetical protein COA84_12340 [Robiginitomaculum sp.]|nr:MAG: hypothetical protein COA84_12340 [Robiginitomaculum sp.]